MDSVRDIAGKYRTQGDKLEDCCSNPSERSQSGTVCYCAMTSSILTGTDYELAFGMRNEANNNFQP